MLASTSTRSNHTNNDDVHRHQQYHRHPNHFLAQTLTNQGSHFISAGKFEEGIALLINALQLAERDILSGIGDGYNNKTSSCTHCSLESCLAKGMHTVVVVEEETNNHHTGENKNTSSHNHVRFNDNDSHKNEKIASLVPSQQQRRDVRFVGDDNDDGFVYCRPLFVNEICIKEGHFMGNITLSLVIVFNLALAYHTKAIAIDNETKREGRPSGDTASMATMKALQHALQLYEKAYELHSEYVRNNQQRTKNNGCQIKNSEQSSLLLTMIISNNLSDIHKKAGNIAKQNNCLQHLLSMVTYAIDRKLPVVLDPSEMDGFYRNVSKIILDDVCAQVA